MSQHLQALGQMAADESAGPRDGDFHDFLPDKDTIPAHFPSVTPPAETLPETGVRWLMRHIPSRPPFSRERN